MWLHPKDFVLPKDQNKSKFKIFWYVDCVTDVKEFKHFFKDLENPWFYLQESYIRHNGGGTYPKQGHNEEFQFVGARNCKIFSICLGFNMFS